MERLNEVIANMSEMSDAELAVALCEGEECKAIGGHPNVAWEGYCNLLNKEIDRRRKISEGRSPAIEWIDEGRVAEGWVDGDLLFLIGDWQGLRDCLRIQEELDMDNGRKERNAIYTRCSSRHKAKEVAEFYLSLFKSSKVFTPVPIRKEYHAGHQEPGGHSYG